MKHEEFTAYTIYIILASVSFFCVIITVFRTKSVRNQLLGAMLINLAVGNYLLNIFYMHQAELAYMGISSASMSDTGTLGCYFYLSTTYISTIVTNISIVVILVDVIFILPQNRKSQILVTVVIWVMAVILSVVVMLGVHESPLHHHVDTGNECYINVRNPQWISESPLRYIFYGVSEICIIAIVIIICILYDKSMSFESRKVPFFLTIAIYLVLSWIADLLLFVSRFTFFRTVEINMTSFYLWPPVIRDCGMVLISIVWLCLTPDLRNTVLCKTLRESNEVPFKYTVQPFYN